MRTFITPPAATAVALSGHALVVLTKTRTIELYYAPSGSPSMAFTLPPGSQAPQNLDVQGSIAIYTVGGAVHALNLGSRKDRVIGKLSGGIGTARISSAGVAYSSSRFRARERSSSSHSPESPQPFPERQCRREPAANLTLHALNSTQARIA